MMSLLRWLEWRNDPRSLPYPMGVYLFPVGVVDAMTSRPRVYPFTELKSLEGSQPARQVPHCSCGATIRPDSEHIALCQFEQIRNLVEDVGNLCVFHKQRMDP